MLNPKNTLIRSSGPISLNNVVVNHLCKGHNSDLGPVDAEMGRFVDSLEAIMSGTSSAYNNIDGQLIERWILKTAVNENAIHLNMIEAPIEQMAKVAFGIESFPGLAGLYINHPRELVFNDETRRMYLAARRDAKNSIIGESVYIFGFEFFLLFVNQHSKLPEDGFIHHLSKIENAQTGEGVSIIW